MDTNRLGVATVGHYHTEHTDEFSRPANTTAYTAGDRISEDTNDSDTTALRTLFTARIKGAAGRIVNAVLMTDDDGFTDTVRLHLFQEPAPATAIPGDNAAMGVVYANRDDYLGYVDFSALAEPDAAGVSDVTIAQLQEKEFAFVCQSDDKKIYYALQTLGTGTPSSGQSFYLRTEIEED